jgi:hypothetical protein
MRTCCDCSEAKSETIPLPRDPTGGIGNVASTLNNPGQVATIRTRRSLARAGVTGGTFSGSLEAGEVQHPVPQHSLSGGQQQALPVLATRHSTPEWAKPDAITLAISDEITAERTASENPDKTCLPRRT